MRSFGQWRAARRLVERGATTTLWQDDKTSCDLAHESADETLIQRMRLLGARRAAELS
jgi:hypothetical protein